MVCRDQNKGETAMAEVRSQSGNSSVELMVADLSSLESVRKLAAEFKQRFQSLHVLDNNAGAILGKCVLTADGIESTFAINFLSHFLLTNILLDTLKSSAPSRVINVTSDAHFSGHMDFGSLRCENPYSASRAYSQAKLAQVVFTYSLARTMSGTGVTVNCVHPGAVRTNWGSSAGGAFGFMMKIVRPFLASSEKGADGPVYLASSPIPEGVTGKFFSKTKEAQSSKESYDQSIAERLWNVSAEMTRLSA
jgi:NAD(P)-dependent dehydrogenase (short-subunit alcohol dehydrogenase family)